MVEAPLPADEPERVAALHALGILDTPADEHFDRLTRLARRIFDVPIALVSLVDANRQWFKSCIGLPAPETQRAVSFCAHAIHSDDILEIPDAAADARFVDNPLVTGPPHIRFYAGRPLRTPDGFRVGTLCVIDVKPRRLRATDREVLSELGALAEEQLAGLQLSARAIDLHSAESRLRAITDAAAEGIAMVDERELVAFVNPAAAESLGYSPEELIGRSLHEAVHHTHADGSPYPFDECPMFKTLTEGTGVRRADEVFWRKDGSPMSIEYSSSPIREGNQIRGGVVTWSDITERIELDRMKDQFVSSVSHEFRTPLTSIKGYVDALLDEDAGPLGEEQREFLGVVSRNTDRLTSLISDLLLMSRLRAGKVIVSEAHVDLGVIAGQVVEELQPMAARRDMTIDDELGPALVVGDARHLSQAIANLVSNAIKFSPAGGTVRVRVMAADGECVLEVADDGVGIPPDEVERIGTRFFRSSNATGVEGTGLGLAITQEIMAVHDGALEVDSEIGRGSTFRLRFPRPDGSSGR